MTWPITIEYYDLAGTFVHGFSQLQPGVVYLPDLSEYGQLEQRLSSLDGRPVPAAIIDAAAAYSGDR